jgi:hypothetical protein
MKHDYHLNYGWANLHLDETPKNIYHIRFSANFICFINLAKVIPLGLMLPRKYENNDGDKGFWWNF